MKERPGVLLYFSLRPAIKRLTLEEKGALFEAILDYAQNGVYPDFDGVLGICWDFVQPLIDADGEAYRDKCEKAKKAIETRWAKEKNTQEYGRIQTNTEHTNNNSNSNTIPISIPNAISIIGGGMEGEEQQTENFIVSSLDRPEPLDFEKARADKLKAFSEWARKQEI